eukprot:TRINITY_DN5685_c0_g1_i2.p1 TRINITY_DN5685_c0_g1~~TRINITY_DN5685_c0_g1_i2.p1  ORF type:complete len:386 (-),score=45.64 TRINITY_DN5685_c0_g1_i2:225-1382(-)
MLGNNTPLSWRIYRGWVISRVVSTFKWLVLHVHLVWVVFLVLFVVWPNEIHFSHSSVGFSLIPPSTIGGMGYAPLVVSSSVGPTVRIHVASDPWIPFGTRSSRGDCSEWCYLVDSSHAHAADAVLFSIPSWGEQPIPPKPLNQMFIAFNLEPFRMRGRRLLDPAYATQFDLIASFNADTSPLPTLYDMPTDEQLLTAVPYSRVPRQPDALVAFISSRCEPHRDGLVKELMRYVSVASYGRCVNNRPRAPGNYFHLNHIIAAHPFFLGIENTNETWYVSEKFWQGYLAGSVPIYWGPPQAKLVEPGHHSAIFVDDFPSIEALAKHLKYLAENPDEYVRYFEWKNRPLRPQFHYFRKLDHQDMICRTCQAVALHKYDVNVTISPVVS